MYNNKKAMLGMLTLGMALSSDPYTGLSVRRSFPKVSELQDRFKKKYNSLSHSTERRKKRKRKIKLQKIARRAND
ncbi:unnamed protein product [marine sediment metagenome]|uniref:Uncharacterized protein n=1 Tax=marine sediment metagenome TaxID=412755 RepID=X1M4X8_9ZZZZ